MSSAAIRQPLVIAGLPGESWAFAIRIWLAVVLALYTSFWLQLDAPSSSAVTVGILAVPTRGQGIEKAAYRLIATVIGVVVSIAIVGVFTQTGWLLIAVFAAWIGLCVYAAGLLDGNRAYAAALCIITVALIAIGQIDSPQNVFDAGIGRGSAIAIGVLAVMFVNDLLAAPDYYPKIAAQLDALHRRVTDYARSTVAGQTMPAATAAVLLRDITVLRPDIASIATESSSGQARSAAARAAMVNLVAELSAAWALEALPVAAAPAVRDDIIAQLDGRPGHTPQGPAGNASASRGDDGLMAAGLDWLTGRLRRKNQAFGGSLEAMRTDAFPARSWRAPLYRSHRIAAATGIRAAIYFALAAAAFMATGWSSTEASLSIVAVLIGLSATVPDARLFTLLAVISTPTAWLLAGILEFVVLDGVDGFPLLAIALAPFVIGCALLITLPNPAISTIGRLNLIFIISLFAPTNPETYNPETFLFSGVLAIAGTSMLLAVQFLLPPLSNERRLRYLVAAAKGERDGLNLRRRQKLEPEEALFHDAGRVRQIVAAGGTAPENRDALDEAMRCFDRTAALRLAAGKLDRLADGPLAKLAEAARKALDQRDPAAMLASAGALRQGAAADDAEATSAALVIAAAILSAPPAAEPPSEMNVP